MNDLLLVSGDGGGAVSSDQRHALDARLASRAGRPPLLPPLHAFLGGPTGKHILDLFNGQVSVRLFLAHVAIRTLTIGDGLYRILFRLLAGEEVRDGKVVSQVYHQGKEEEGYNSLDHRDLIRRPHRVHEVEPDIGEQREEGRAHEHGKLIDASVLPRRDGHDAHRCDGEKIERGRADDRGRPQFPGLLVEAQYRLDEREHDLWRARAQGHQREVGDGGVPEFDGELDDLPGCDILAPDDLLFLGDDVDGRHEDVAYDGDAEKGVDEHEEVYEGLELVREQVEAGEEDPAVHALAVAVVHDITLGVIRRVARRRRVEAIRALGQEVGDGDRLHG